MVRKAAREAFGQQAWLRPRLWLGAAASLLLLVIGGAWALWDHNPQWRPPATPEQPALVQPTKPDVPVVARTEPTTPQTESSPSPASQENAAPSEPSAPEPAVASTTPAPHADRLVRPAGVSASDSQRDAYAAVFDRWNAPFEPNDVPCNQAPQVGLQCLKMSGTWHDIERVDQPVVIELWDDRAEPYYAALVSHRGDVMTIKLGGKEIETTPDELANHWYGGFVVLWQMPPDYRGNLKFGDQGPSVAWLRQHLAAALQIDLRAPDPSRFDDGLRAALIRFQRENGMVPDGVAGPMTWIAMNAAASDTTPRLSAGT